MRHGRRAFSLIELLVVLGILVLLAALLFPVIASVRRSGHQSVCTSNLRQLGMALRHYLDNWDEAFPQIFFDWSGLPATEAEQRANPQSFPNVFQAYAPLVIFQCPNDTGAANIGDVASKQPVEESNWLRWGTSYRPAAEIGNDGGHLADIPDTAAIFWAADSSGTWSNAYWRPPLSLMVDNTGSVNDMGRWKLNAVFLDGHVSNAAFFSAVWNPYLVLLGQLEGH